MIEQDCRRSLRARFGQRDPRFRREGCLSYGRPRPPISLAATGGGQGRDDGGRGGLSPVAMNLDAIGRSALRALDEAAIESERAIATMLGEKR